MQTQTEQRLTEEEIREEIQEVLARYQKLRAAIWPAGLARETVEHFRKQVKELEAQRQ